VIITTHVGQREQKKSLIDYLVERFKYLTSEPWVERILEGRFTIGEEICSADRVLLLRETLLYDAPPFQEPAADLSYSIVFESDIFLAVNKPGNLLVHKKGSSITHNLIYQLRENNTPPFPEADIVNRLDRETSGVVLVSKGKDGLRELSDLFADRLVEKEYLAIVHGTPNQSCGTITLPLMPDPTGTIRSRQIVSALGKSAETLYEVIDSNNGKSLVRLFPKTGRTHQLRVHLASMGCPIVGDKLYGLSHELYAIWRKTPELIDLEFPRQALHCSAIRFEFRGKSYEITADLPNDLVDLCKEYQLNL